MGVQGTRQQHLKNQGRAQRILTNKPRRLPRSRPRTLILIVALQLKALENKI